MKTVCVAVFGLLLSTALSAPAKVKEQLKTMFLGEDFQIPLTSPASDVVFLPRSTPSGPEIPLMTAGIVVNPLARLNEPLSHLIVYNLKEELEGLYTVKNSQNPEDVRRITLIVRDCSLEQSVMYGDNYHIQLSGVTPPITLEYRHIAIEANQTDRPALILYTQSRVSREGYEGRISVNDKRVVLNAVTGSDEGSYTVRDGEGKIKKKVCLNVKVHQNFYRLPYDSTLKMNLILNSSLVQVVYVPEYDAKARLIVDKGNLVFPPDLSLEGRLSLDGSVCTLEGLTGSDDGHFQVTDIQGFPVSNIYLHVEAYKLPPVYVAIISLVGLLAFLLLVCLISCLFKVRKRAKRAEALEKIAHSKDDDGEAFRQVVKNITQFNEDSKGHSLADNTDKSQSTEVDIKGLEVSSKEILEGANLETSDSGVEFNTTGLPLDTDTDAPDQFLDSEAVTLSAAYETKASAPPAPEFKPASLPVVKSSAPAPVVQKSPVPESKPSPPPVIKSSPPPVPKSSPPPEVKSSPPPVPKSSPPPEVKSSPPPVPKSSPPPEVKSSPPPVPKSSPPPEVKSSPPPVPKSSPPPEVKSSPPPVIKSSPLPEVKSIPPPEVKSSPPLVTKSSPPPEIKSSPLPVLKSSPTLEVKSSPPPVIKSSPLPEVKSIPPPEVKSSPPPVPKSSPPPEIKSSPPPVPKSSPPPEIKSSPPPVPKSSPPPEIKSSPPPVLKSSPPPEIKSSPPPVPKSSPPPEIKSSPPPVPKSSPPPEVKSSPPPVPKSSPPLEIKSSPPPVLKDSPPPEMKSSPPPVLKASPPPEIKSSPPLIPKSSPSPEIKFSPPPVIKSSPPPEVNKSPESSADSKLLVTKPVDTKSSPLQSPDPKLMPSPMSIPSPGAGLESKTPEPTPSPEPKLTPTLSPSPKAIKPQSHSPKLAVTPDSPKPTTPEPAPTTNGTLEPAPESKSATDHTPTDLIGSSPASKATPPKTPEVEVKAAKEPPLEVSSGSPSLEAKGEASTPTKVEDTTAISTST